MTLKINGTTISLTRGDTCKIGVDIFNPDGSLYVPVQGDSVRFAMKKNYKSDTVIMEKDIPINTLLLRIEPEDTKSLPQPSEYVYDIQLTHANGEIDTFIAKAIFKITEEVE